MKRIAIAATAILALAAGPVLASPELAKSSGCLNCHDVEKKKVGPSFKSISEKFKGKADAEAQILAVMNDPKKHPATKASDADKKTLVKWVLSQ